MAPRKNAPARGPLSLIYTCPVTAKAGLVDVSDLTYAVWAEHSDAETRYIVDPPKGVTISLYCKDCEQSHEVIEYVC